jgi:TolB-like protein/Flp pilus assembly protein TadD
MRSAMTDSVDPAPAAAAPADRQQPPAAGRLAKLWEQLKRFRGPIVAIAGIGAVLSGFLGYWRAYETVHSVVVPTAAPAAVAADAGPLSIVVLPFANLTGDSKEDYVADGLTASLTADLSRIRDAFIVNAATAFAYKDKPATAQQVGKDLGVHFVLQGSVQRSGTRIRINAQLADANSNALLWSENFEGDEADLFALQDQVTTRIGNSIGREMVIVAARQSEARKSSPRVADLMLRASALYFKPMSLQILQQEEAMYRQVLSLEPSHAGALAELAACLALQVDNFSIGMEPGVQEKKLREARDLALQAKGLDPDNPRVYVPLAVYAHFNGDADGALTAEETRLALEPKNPAAYNNVAALLLFRGESKRAIELETQALNLDPKHPSEHVLTVLGIAYFMQGDNDAAIKWLQKSLEADPAHIESYEFLAMAYALKGENAKAHAAAAELRRLNPKLTLSAVKAMFVALKTPKMDEWFDSEFAPTWRKAGLPE